MHPKILEQADLVSLKEPEEPVLVLKKPEVTVDNWTLNKMQNGNQFLFHDRENPDLDYRIRVWIENGSMYAEITNKIGSGRTGAFRPVVIQE